MAIAWPSSLPVNPARYNEQKQPVTARTQPDSGPSKARRRFTKPMTKGTMEYMLTNAQAIVLDDFWYLTLKAGSIKVLMRHPWRNTTIEMWIPEAPALNDDGPLNVRASFRVEYL